jgi:DNA-binding MarR family transcriptional regulator
MLQRYRDAVTACAVMNLRQASRVITAYFDDELRPTGLRATQLNILMAIEVGAGSTITGLAEILAMERTTMTRNLQLLRRRGWIDPTRIALTASGRRAAAAAMPHWEKAQKTVVKTLGEKRWSALLRELGTTKRAVRSESQNRRARAGGG